MRGAEIAVIVASATGTAHEAAGELSQCAVALGHRVGVASFGEIDIADLPRLAWAAFVVATAGDAQFPHQAKLNWRLLRRRDLPPNSLRRLRYGVFGLGDRAYGATAFNAAARRLHARLSQLGAKPILPCGLGDAADEGGYLAALKPWAATFFGVPETEIRIPMVAAAAANGHDTRLDRDVEMARTAPNATSFTVLSKKEISVGVYELWLRAVDPKPGDVWGPGDAVATWPPPHQAIRDGLVALLERQSGATAISGVPEISGALRPLENLEIMSPPSPTLLARLATTATNDRDRDQLTAIAADPLELMAYGRDAGRTILDVLAEVPSLAPTPESLVAWVPRLSPRFYSVASAWDGRGDPILRLIVQRSPLLNRIRRLRYGRASTYLANLEPGEVVSLGIGPRANHPPPKIAIATGTGCAVLLALVSARALQGLVDELPVYLGFRDRILAEEDWRGAAGCRVTIARSAAAQILELGPTLDQDRVVQQNRGGRVTSALLRDRIRVQEALGGGGAVWVIGRVAVVKDVRECISAMLGGDQQPSLEWVTEAWG